MWPQHSLDHKADGMAEIVLLTFDAFLLPLPPFLQATRC
jgi:hypothetical protein